ncbi:hypothetical protein DM40_4574 [Burkholderia cenocepacia]|nr:hypothetical protein DM40_4574 [Burkholderia cenocepacia]
MALDAHAMMCDTGRFAGLIRMIDGGLAMVRA